MDEINTSPLTLTTTESLKSSSPISVRIKTNEHTSYITVSTTNSATVQQFKETVLRALGPSARGRYLRLISNGRLLAPDSAELYSFRLKEDSVVHAVLAAAGVRGGQQAILARSSGVSSRRSRGTGISYDGLVLSSNSTDGDSDNEDIEQGTERMGFDRLRSEGLNRTEINILRIYFSRQIDRFIEQRQRLSENNSTTNNNTTNSNNNNNNSNTNTNNNENTNSDSNDDSSDPDESARLLRLRMEDEWMETQGPNSEFRLNLNSSNPLMANRSTSLFTRNEDLWLSREYGLTGTTRDFIWGLVLGYFAGVMMMFWVWLPTVPYRQKVGILSGMCLKMMTVILLKVENI